MTYELLTSSKFGILNEALNMFTHHKVLFHSCCEPFVTYCGAAFELALQIVGM
jgi:hypothetical protein